MEKDGKPRMFIGSSVEGLPVAEAIQEGLEFAAEVTIWSQGVFGLTEGTLEALVRATADFDFAVLVLTPDDLTVKRQETVNAARDNVLFELGLFMGALGRSRTAIVYCRDDDLDVPTDLAGITPATFPRRQDGNLQAALGPACSKLKRMLANPVDRAGAQLLSFVDRAADEAAMLTRLMATEDVAQRAYQADALREELEAVRSELQSLRELAVDLLCPTCQSPVISRGFDIECVEHNGREHDIEHEWAAYDCGYRVHNGIVEEECPEAVLED